MQKSLELLWLIFQIPTEPQQWIKYVPVSQADSKPEYKAFPALAMVDFKIAGMSKEWKIANIAFIVAPKMALWWMIVWMGFRLLMETAGIMSLVLGAMALSFILGIDELVLETFGSQASMHILDEIDGYMFKIEDDDDEGGQDKMSDEEALLHQEEIAKRQKRSCYHAVWLLVPKKMVATSLVMLIFMSKYYTSKCHLMEDGSFVSNRLYLPLGTTYTFDNMFSDSFSWGSLRWSAPSRDLNSPLWCMPNDDCPAEEEATPAPTEAEAAEPEAEGGESGEAEEEAAE
jgi:hypothetical protein